MGLGQEFTPTAASAEERGFTGRKTKDPLNYQEYDERVVSAKFIGNSWQNELLALWKAAVASGSYQNIFDCDLTAGLRVGDPVYVAGDNRVGLATAEDETKAQVIGFIAYMPTPDTAIIEHYRKIDGFTGLIFGMPIFLSNSGSYDSAPGTIEKAVGVAISSESALLMAAPGGSCDSQSVFKATTYDDVPVVIASIPIPLRATLKIDVNVVARRVSGSATDDSGHASGNIQATVVRHDGDAELPYLIDSLFNGDLDATLDGSEWDCTVAVQGGEALIIVIGDENSTVNWTMKYSTLLA